MKYNLSFDTTYNLHTFVGGELLENDILLMCNSYTGESISAKLTDFSYAEAELDAYDSIFYFIDGMTWKEYINSPYNHLNFRIANVTEYAPDAFCDSPYIVNDMIRLNDKRIKYSNNTTIYANSKVTTSTIYYYDYVAPNTGGHGGSVPV